MSTWDLCSAIRYRKQSTKKREKVTCHQSITLMVADIVQVRVFRTAIDAVFGIHSGLRGNLPLDRKEARSAPSLTGLIKTMV
jgi:hypothetical protein